MKQNAVRKTDRRTLYTKNIIKEALLKLKHHKAFSSITVTDICRESEISRGTFYLHYNNISDVLDEVLDDAFSKVKSLLGHLSLINSDSVQQCAYPLCCYIRENKKYRCIFFDDSLTSYIINKITSLYKDDFVDEVSRRTELTQAQIEAIFYFQISGCFAVSKKNGRLNNEEWCSVQCIIDNFIKNGLEACFKKKEEIPILFINSI